MPVLLAGVVVLGCWLVRDGTPPPLFWATAAFLALAVESDVRSLRLPNALTFGALAAAIAFHALAPASFGAMGIAGCLLGIAAGFGILVLPYAAGFLGAGDVKAAMALGAWVGALVLVDVLLWAALIGAAIGLTLLAMRGDLVDLVHRWWRSAIQTLCNGRLIYFAPSEGSAAAEGLPFALTLGLAFPLACLLGGPWS